MARVAVLYHSSTGTNRLMAEAVLRGAEEARAETSLLEIRGEDIHAGRWKNDEVLEELGRCDAIVFGCPTFMGSASAQMKAFMDATLPRYFDEAWKDKVAAGFTVSGAPSGDKLSTLFGLAAMAMQLGMIWVGTGVRVGGGDGLNRLGVSFGAAGMPDYAKGGGGPHLETADHETGVFLGKRVAEIAARLQR